MVKMKVKRKIYHDPKKGLKRGVQESLTEITNLLHTSSKAYAPVDTGFLRGSIFQKFGKFKSWVVARADYSIFQEEGKRAANGGRGFMKPAAQYVKTKLTGILGRNIRFWLRRVK